MIIHWKKEPSVPIMGSILGVDEIERTFCYQVFGTQGKKRNTYFDIGKTLEADENLVWRLIHRKEFECERTPVDIRTGQMIRVRLQDQISDSTGLVLNVRNGTVAIKYISGIYENRSVEFHTSQVATVHEIMSSPLFYNLKKLFMCNEEQGKIVWKNVQASDSVDPMEAKEPLVIPADESMKGEERKPRMLLEAPANCKSKRL